MRSWCGRGNHGVAGVQPHSLRQGAFGGNEAQGVEVHRQHPLLRHGQVRQEACPAKPCAPGCCRELEKLVPAQRSEA